MYWLVGYRSERSLKNRILLYKTVLRLVYRLILGMLKEIQHQRNTDSPEQNVTSNLPDAVVCFYILTMSVFYFSRYINLLLNTENRLCFIRYNFLNL